MEEMGERFRAARLESLVVLTPHGVHVEGALGVVVSDRAAGQVHETGGEIHLDLPVDGALALQVVAGLREAELPVVSLSFGVNDPSASVFPLDWGALIPLWYLGGRFDPPCAVVILSPSRQLSPQEHLRAGRALAQTLAATSTRTAVIASADHGHAHQASGPYGFDPAAKEYDDAIVRLVAENRLEALEAIDPVLVQRAKADSWWQLLALAGAVPHATWDLLSYEAPTYFGMACAVAQVRRAA